MATIKCKMCGGTIEINGNETTLECEYCGSRQTLPRISDDRKANLFDRATHFRNNSEFDKAEAIYEQILNEDPNDAESYWSLVLCRYGIQYVEDPATHKMVPTVNRTQFSSVFEDENFKSAMRLADSSQQEIYTAEAKQIDEIQKGILEISKKEKPFDVFICYKETDDTGKRTRDSVLGQELYNELTKVGFKVFFARITLKSKLGQAYEPYIFSALNSSKVMVVIGTKAEYFNAPWVKNEWSRYLALINSGEGKTLIPTYKDMDPYDLPNEFSFLQALDMSKLGFMQDLVEGIQKIVGSKKESSEKEHDRDSSPAKPDQNPLLKRAMLFIEDNELDQADGYIKKVLDQEPENPMAYLAQTLSDYCSHVLGRGGKLSDLISAPEEFLKESKPYKKALRFANDEFRNKFLSKRSEYFEESRVSFIESTREEIKNAESTNTLNIIRSSIDKASSLWNLEDLIKEWKAKYDVLNAAEEEQERLEQQKRAQAEAERKAIEAREEAKKQELLRKQAAENKRKGLIVSIILIILVAAFAIFYVTVLGPSKKKREAIESYNAASEEERVEMFPDMIKYGYEKPTASFYDGESLISSSVLMPGDSIQFPEMEDTTGKHFIGWVENDSDVIISESTMKTADVSFHAAYGYDVTYLDYKGDVLQTFQYPEGTEYTVAKILDKNLDVMVSKWKTEGSSDIFSDSSKEVISHNTIYHAVYSLNIQFKYLDGTIIQENTVDYGQDVTAPSYKADSGFKGWSLTSDDDAKIITDKSFKVTKDKNVYYLRSDNEISFSSDGTPVNLPKGFEVESGFSYVLPSSPISSVGSKAFFGWQVGDKIYQAGESLEIKGNTTISAVYGEIMWQGISTAGYYSCYVDKSGKIVDAPKTVDDLRNVTEYRISKDYFTISEGRLSLSSDGQKNKSVLQYFVIPDDVTEISNSAFSGCSELRSVVLPSSITKIGNYAFSGCNKLTFDSLDLTKVKSIGSNAFQNCSIKILTLNDNTKNYDSGWFTSVKETEELVYAKGTRIAYNFLNDNTRKTLASVTLPEGLTEIANSAFSNCKELKSITIPSSVTKIGQYAFSGCSFEALDLTNVTSVGSNAFQSCSITKLTVNDNVKYYDSGWLYSAKETEELVYAKGTKVAYNVLTSNMRGTLTKLTLPDGLTEVADSAFSNCKELKSITIPSSVTKIGSYAFSSCSFAALDLSNVTSVGGNAFQYCSILKLTVNDNVKNYVSGWLNYAKETEELVYAKGTKIAYNVLNDNTRKTLVSVTLPEGLTEIANSAFSNCKELKSITIPSSVTKIGTYAFSSCSFAALDLSNVTSVGGNAFQYCSILKLTVNDNVKNYDSSWNYNIKDTEELVYANGTKTAYNVRSASISETLTKVILPEGLTEISNNAFYNCSKLESATIPSTVIKIGESAFRYCKELKSLAIPSSVTTIGSEAFTSCSFDDLDLTNVTSVGYNAFFGCSIIKLTVNDNVKNYNYWNQSVKDTEELVYASGTKVAYFVLTDNTRKTLTKVSLPDGLTEIANSAFEECKELKSISIPSSVKKIGNRAFSYSGCSFTSLDLTNVTSVGSAAFRGCSISELIVNDNVKNYDGNWRESIGSVDYLCIPKNSSYDYSKLFPKAVISKY